MVKEKNKIIDIFYEVPEHIKKEYLNHKGKSPFLIVVEIYKNKKYGAVAKIFQRNSMFDRFQEQTTKKQRADWNKKIKKMPKVDDNKPVDTSKWVKPDEESLRNALIKHLFALQILKPDSPNYQEHKGKAAILYSILHSHSPSNPQGLTNFCFGQIAESYFETIMREFKVPEGRVSWEMINDKYGKYVGVKKHRSMYKSWKEKCLKKMIIPDPKPPKFVDIFKKNYPKKPTKIRVSKSKKK